MDFKVMTFNIRVDVPADDKKRWMYRSRIVANTINDHKPAIVGTQEALLSMIKDMEEDLSSNYCWIGEGRRGGMNDEFCAIFYDNRKLRCIESGQFWLSETPDVPNSVSWNSSYPRICTWGYFTLISPPYDEFIVFNTHLDHVSQEARENGITLLLDRMKQYQNKYNIPAILMGDFNCEPSNKVFCFLSDDRQGIGLKNAFDALDEKCIKTFHNFDGGMKGDPIDYIFGTKEWEFLETKVDRRKMANGFPSDHYPVIATIAINQSV